MPVAERAASACSWPSERPDPARWEQLDDRQLLALVLRRIPEPELVARLLHGGEPWFQREPAWWRAELRLPEHLAERLAAALELGRRRAARAPAPVVPVRGGYDVYHYLSPRFLGCREERLWALYLDSKGRLVRERQVSQGTLTTSLVHPREVFAPAVQHQAAAVIVAHNHPSGDPEPSAEDHATTRRLQRAGRLLGIELLDHLVVGAARYRSFQECGWL